MINNDFSSYNYCYFNVIQIKLLFIFKPNELEILKIKSNGINLVINISKAKLISPINIYYLYSLKS